MAENGILFDFVGDVSVSTASVECSALSAFEFMSETQRLSALATSIEKSVLVGQKRANKLYERAIEVLLRKERIELIFK